MEIKEIKVIANRLDNFNKTISKIKKMYGVQKAYFSIEEKGTKIEPVTYKNEVNRDVTKNFLFHYFEIKYTPIVANNQYSIVGNLIKNKEQLLITYLNEDMKNKIDPRLFHDSLTCDHCNTNRRRKQVLIVYDNINKKFMRLGKSCLQAYIPSTVDSVIKLIEYSNVFFSEEWGGGNYGEYHSYYNFTDMINILYAEITTNGYHKRTLTYGDATFERAIESYQDNDIPEESILTDFYSYLKEEQRKPNSFLNYQLLHNLRVFYKENAVIDTYINQLSFVVLKYIESLNKKENKQPTPTQENISTNTETKLSEFVGEKGQKITRELRLISARQSYGDFGYYFIYLFKDNEDNELLYFGTSELDAIYKDKENFKNYVSSEYEKVDKDYFPHFNNFFNEQHVENLEKFYKDKKINVSFKVKDHKVNTFGNKSTKQTLINYIKKA